jgi:hypothetical protein
MCAYVQLRREASLARGILEFVEFEFEDMVLLSENLILSNKPFQVLTPAHTKRLLQFSRLGVGSYLCEFEALDNFASRTLQHQPLKQYLLFVVLELLNLEDLVLAEKILFQIVKWLFLQEIALRQTHVVLSERCFDGVELGDKRESVKKGHEGPFVVK